MCVKEWFPACNVGVGRLVWVVRAWASDFDVGTALRPICTRVDCLFLLMLFTLNC